MFKDGQKVNNNSSITNEVEVLNGVDLSIIKGEFLTVVGPSGCGKSVLLDIIGGPSFKTGYVFQQYALFPWRNALSNIEFGLETHGIQKEEREKIAMVFYAAVWFMLVNTISGVKNVDPLYIKAAKSFGISNYYLFKKVILPGSFPSIFCNIIKILRIT